MLFVAQAVLGSQLQVNIILGGLAGALLADNPALATLPISLIMLVSMFVAPLASHVMGRFGRRIGFLIGAAGGGVGGALSASALMIGSFELLLVGAGFSGLYYSFHVFYRFAAADMASEAFKPKAISWVLAGGLVGAVLGSEIVQNASDYFSPVPFAGAYAAIVLLSVVGSVALLFLDIPVPTRPDKDASSGRPLGEIVRQRKTAVAIVCAMIAYGVMTLVMTSTSLSMVAVGFTASQAADVVRWHALAMFGPSFVTGTIIARLGHVPVMTAGLILLCGAIATALTGVELAMFYISLVMLGVGWNFMFVGATSLLASAHAADERAKVQGFNDFLVLATVSAASFGSGALLNLSGWEMVQYAAIPSLIVAAFAIAWLAAAGREPAPVAAE